MLVFGVFVNYYLVAKIILPYSKIKNLSRKKRPRQQNIYPEGIRYMFCCFAGIYFITSPTLYMPSANI